MTNDVIEKYVEDPHVDGKPVNIFFKQRNSITGHFIKAKDYDELKAKNFWRVVNVNKIDQWKKTNDIDLARLFNGTEFSKLK